MELTTEIITLIIGTILGALLTFCFNHFEKYQEYKSEIKKSMMCLKIELRPIKSSILALERAKKQFGNLIPQTDIIELNYSTQPTQVMNFKDTLAEKIFELSLCLRDINENRRKASELIKNPSDPNFQSAALMYEQMMNESKKILNDINNMIHFE